MRHARSDVGHDSRAAALHIVGRDAAPPRPAWRLLAWTFGVVMGLWAAGILELPASDRRLLDWVGGVTALVVLVVWVRANARWLALIEPRRDAEARVPLRVRLIRSRPAPITPIGGPHLERPRRRTGRVPPS
jgi:hypothetical protein